MSTEVDDMVALVESWETYLVPEKREEPSPHAGMGSESSADIHSLDTPTSYGAFMGSRSSMIEACPFLWCNQNDCGSSVAEGAGWSAPSTASSLLWLLTMISRNNELLRAAAHLVLQFNAQFAAVVNSNTASMDTLRERHQYQLASLLEVADNQSTVDMIVDSSVTERVVLQQKSELEALEQQHTKEECRLEREFQLNLWAFLNTSVQDAVTAVARKELSSERPGGADGDCNGGEPWYAEVDVSRYAEVRKRAPANPHRSDSAIAPYSPLLFVPVRTIRLSNEVGDVAAAGAIATGLSSSKKQSLDAMLQPIVLDVSPVSGLKRCLSCCSGTQAGAILSTVSSAAEAHLSRLANTRHSILLLIGGESAAMRLLQECKAPELLLGDGHSCRDGFRPLPHHPSLQILFSTRLWGANAVLLWNPACDAIASATTRTVIEDALSLAYAWDADMFSVAVLEGAHAPRRESVAASQPRAALTGLSSVSSAFFAAQSLSIEVLRQLRNGVTRELINTAGAQRHRRWDGPATWMQQDASTAIPSSTASTRMCPRAVGVLYGHCGGPPCAPSLGPHRASSIGLPHDSSVSPRGDTSTSSLLSSPSVSAPIKSPAAARRGPNVAFNTPLAIRAFLPLPEEFFVDDGTRRPDQLVANQAEDGRRGVAGVRMGTAYRVVSGRSDSGVSWAGKKPSVTALEGAAFTSVRGAGKEDSLSGHRRFSPWEGGDHDGGSDVVGWRNAREVMSLESLIQYAFGEFAAVL